LKNATSKIAARGVRLSSNFLSGLLETDDFHELRRKSGSGNFLKS
jgi:hypothetical protein